MQRPSPPAAVASTLLEDSERLVARSRRRSAALFTGFPFVVWGLAWVVAHAGLELLPMPWSPVVYLVALALAIVLSWLPRGQGVRSGHERPLRQGWFVVAAASPFLVSTIAPIDAERAALFLTALWSLALALTGVALADWAVLGVCFGSVALAGVAPHLPGDIPLTVYGCGSGAALVTLGLLRMGRGRVHG